MKKKASVTAAVVSKKAESFWTCSKAEGLIWNEIGSMGSMQTKKICECQENYLKYGKIRLNVYLVTFLAVALMLIEVSVSAFHFFF